MQTLHHDLEKLRKLSEMRERVTVLRDNGYASLRKIEEITPGDTPKIVPSGYEQWQAMGNVIEAATILKIKRHWRLKPLKEGPTASFEKRIEINIDSLFPEAAERDSGSEKEANYLFDRRVPVLVAAHCMEIFSEKSSTVLSAETMLCYYRILVEMRLATWPDWTVGAARAGEAASVTAFVTGECVRAIMAFQRSLDSTSEFLAETRNLFDRHQTLVEIGELLGEPDSEHPIMVWRDFVMQRIWLDWFIATEPERRAIAFDLYEKKFDAPPSVDEMNAWFIALQNVIQVKAAEAARNFQAAFEQIDDHRYIPEQVGGKDPHPATTLAINNARKFGRMVLETARDHAKELETISIERKKLPELLEALGAKFREFSSELNRILDVSRHYVQGVLDRALADPSNIDVGELAFAAAAYGSATDWQSKQRLKRVCEVLLASVPPSGLPVTRIPFHSTRRGYKLLPTGCHIIGSMALLLIKTGYEFEPEAVEPLLHAIDSRKIEIPNQTAIGWNFEGATSRNTPSVWVTGVTVLALDRMARMLDARINGIVFDHFTVERPEPLRSPLTLNDLIYPDYGLVRYGPSEIAGARDRPMAIHLEHMRAHLLSVKLPADDKFDVSPSVILYGPPATGKTTWAEALASSSRSPLIRLSPFDLIVTPRGPMENVTVQTRARHVFEALSMLTNAVILFDEFEAVFSKRTDAKNHGRPADNAEVPFLLTGLLPMLVKLHDVAATQKLVYCLATNHLSRMDSAAIRQGRFDRHMPVFKPDPLSRAGSFLFRLVMIRRALRAGGDLPSKSRRIILGRLDPGSGRRLMTLIRRTRGLAANILAKDYFRLPDWAKSRESPVPPTWEREIPCFLHVLKDGDPCKARPDDEEIDTPYSGEHPDPKKIEIVAGKFLADYEQMVERVRATDKSASAADILRTLEFGRAEELNP